MDTNMGKWWNLGTIAYMPFAHTFVSQVCERGLMA